MAGWRERIQAIRDRLLGREPPRAEVASETLPLDAAAEHIPNEARRNPVSASRRVPSSRIPLQTSQQIIAVNLGIDFGTSFTKVCFRDVGTEESGIVAIGRRAEQAIIPSIVTIGASGRLYLGDDTACERSPVSIAYLKMRLAGAEIGDALPSLDGRNLNELENIRALAAWFLASVIARAQEWMFRHESDRLRNRRVVWTANVGVPVEHYDSDALETFREVLGVAWLWGKDHRVPATLQSAATSYVEMLPRLKEEGSDFHAIPEIAAAVQSFVMSREAVPGIYVYFDIGGGTVDGKHTPRTAGEITLQRSRSTSFIEIVKT